MARRALVLGVAGLALAAACKREEPAAQATPTAAPAAAPLAAKPFYRLDAVPASCAAGRPCEAKVVLTALGAYHVNKDYPFKFLPDAASPLTGAPAFAHDDATHGTLTLTFQPAAAGTTTLTGTFKLSVCSDDTCEIEKPQIAVQIAVK